MKTTATDTGREINIRFRVAYWCGRSGEQRMSEPLDTFDLAHGRAIDIMYTMNPKVRRVHILSEHPQESNIGKFFLHQVIL